VWKSDILTFAQDFSLDKTSFNPENGTIYIYLYDFCPVGNFPSFYTQSSPLNDFQIFVTPNTKTQVRIICW